MDATTTRRQGLRSSGAAGSHADRRTKRVRTRGASKRNAIAQQDRKDD